MPDLSYPTLTVRTEYTGSAPTEIETLITQPVEEAVGVVKNLRKLKSVSRTGQSDVVLEFAWGTNMDQASLEVRDKMEALNLPLEAKAPVLLRFNPSTEPIMRLVLSSKDVPATDADAIRELTGLRRYADEDLKKKLEPVAGVAAVKVGGGLEDEIQVDIDQQKLAQLNLPIDTVIKRLKDENINISGGRLEGGRSASWCAPSTSSPTWRRSATCWSPPRARTEVQPTRHCSRCSTSPRRPVRPRPSQRPRRRRAHRPVVAPAWSPMACRCA